MNDEALRRDEAFPPSTLISPMDLSLLRCGRTCRPLFETGPCDLAKLNAAIAGGRLRDAAGRRVETLWEGAVQDAQGEWFYPVEDGCPVLLLDAAVPGPPEGKPPRSSEASG